MYFAATVHCVRNSTTGTPLETIKLCAINNYYQLEIIT